VGQGFDLFLGGRGSRHRGNLATRKNNAFPSPNFAKNAKRAKKNVSVKKNLELCPQKLLYYAFAGRFCLQRIVV
jgi:hypothetical protein